MSQYKTLLKQLIVATTFLLITHSSMAMSQSIKDCVKARLDAKGVGHVLQMQSIRRNIRSFAFKAYSTAVETCYQMSQVEEESNTNLILPASTEQDYYYQNEETDVSI